MNATEAPPNTPTASPVLLEVREVSKSFPGVRALDRVSFELQRGEVHVLLGENGAGKSTLMKILSGAYSLDSGQIFLEGAPVAIQNPHHAQQLGIRTIYQEFNLVPHLSVSANIFLGREPMAAPGILDKKTLRRETTRVLEPMAIKLDPDVPVSALNVAQQQMVEVAKALAFDAKIIIMDEPTAALTAMEIRTLFALISKLRERGTGIIYISHRLEEIFAVGDRLTVLRDGRHIATRPVAGATVDELVQLMAGRQLKEHFPRKSVTAGVSVLEVSHLCTRDRLTEVSFTLRAGEIVGIAGLLGSGRSAVARALFGLDPLVSGSIRVRPRRLEIPTRSGSDRSEDAHADLESRPGTANCLALVELRPDSPASAIRAGLGFLPEDRKRQGFVPNLSIRQNIALANTAEVYRHGVRHPARERKLAAELVSQLKIRTPHLDQPVVFLSGGNQQKVVLGKWLACGASVLLFDEPTRGIDVAAKVDIYELMNRLTAEGVGILMISSELPEVLGMSDRILVMHQGRLVAEFSKAEATQEKVLKAALGGGL